MATENERLHNTLYQTEKDTIEVVDYLKQGDLEKDEQVRKNLLLAIFRSDETKNLTVIEGDCQLSRSPSQKLPNKLVKRYLLLP